MATNGNDSTCPIGEVGENPNGDRWFKQNGGLSKREYMATCAMQGILADPASDPKKAGFGEHYSDEFAESVASAAVDYADALIVALNETK